MDRNQAKELLPIIQAYAEGKSIEFSSITDVSKAWREVADFPLGMIDSFKFRIKPEPKYRPFKNAEECWTEMQKHQPFGWLKDIEFAKYFLIDEITSLFSDAQIHISAYERKNWSCFSTVFHNYTFPDGTPFGILEEE